VAMPAHAVGNPGRRAEPTWPRQAFSSIAAMYPAAGQRYCAAISGALSTRPNVDGVAGRIQRSELLPSRDACGPEYRARRTPRSWRGLPPRRSPTLGSVAFRRRGTAGFRRAACAHTGAVHGACGSGSPTRSAGVSMDAK